MLRAEIVGEVRRAMRVVMEEMEEKWISPEELSKQFYFFSPDWISKNGHLLPREKVNVLGGGSTRYGYPLHKINRMVAEGAFRELAWKNKMKAKA